MTTQHKTLWITLVTLSIGALDRCRCDDGDVHTTSARKLMRTTTLEHDETVSETRNTL